jgi:CBS domain containing-hemolysin-like protein
MTWLLLGLTVALLLANGFFVGAEFALIAARRSKIEHLANGGSRNAVTALKSIRELSLTLAGAQLGITLMSFGLGAVAEPAIAKLIESGIASFADLPSGLLHTISFVIALTIVVFFHMVVGEMAPKNIAISRPESSALALAVPMRLFTNVFRPFIRGLNGISNAVLRMVGVEPKDELVAVHTVQEIGIMVTESAKGGLVQDFEHRLLAGAVGFGDRDAADVMVPRTEMVAVPLSVTPAAIEKTVLELGHSRFPVYAEDLDHVVGFFHSKDLLKVPEQDREKQLPRRLVRPLLVVPESKKLQPLLVDMKRERKHFALVIDEHGGTAGIVTLEDILEELVGEILDEYDDDEAGIERLGDGRFLVPGNLRIDEASDHLGVRLPEGEYETIAGFLMDQLGRIPQRRDEVRHDGWLLRVRSMHRRRVVQVLVEKATSSDPGR